jgi:mannose-1-phosphate guanylyltransferase
MKSWQHKLPSHLKCRKIPYYPEMKTTEPIQAVILIGGEGTRLRPLTYTTVKAMVPVLNKPYIEYLIEHLNNHNIKEIILAMGYKPDSIKEYFKKKADIAQKLIYSLEQIPLGTAGAVKNASNYINKNKSFFVINGDIFTNLNFTNMLRFHKKKKAKVTIALTPVDDPTRFGVVEVDCDQRIHRFIEKPKREEAPSNLINAGTYILEPEILERIPGDRKFMFEHDVFPQLISDNKPVYGYSSNTYWIDIGIPENYLKLNFDLLRDTRQIVIDPECTIGQNVQLKGMVVIGPGCTIGNDTIIQDSILWTNINVGDRTIIKNSIVGSDVCVEPATVLENNVIGKNGSTQITTKNPELNKGG